jgi:hypothetical protein
MAVVLAGTARTADAQTAAATGDPIHISRAAGRIVIDGDLSDEGWKNAIPVDRWYETQPGDNVEPRVHSLGYLTYDDRAFYAGFEFDDPRPSLIRAPLSDRDNLPGYTDYGGVILDTRHTGHTAQEFMANPRGIQFDAINDDSTGENASPDFFWQSAAKITDHGWTLEIRIPYSSLRYKSEDPQTWGIMLIRNYPREFRYTIFSSTMPRGGNCFICRSSPLMGLPPLPSAEHIVVAPYATMSETALPASDPGTPLVNGPATAHIGLDAKWTPNADNAADLTVKPDFSQVESDTAQISTNQQFALFFPEKRPFFLEGVELLSTPIQAVYTRTISAPKWGARFTGTGAGTSYTALVADDGAGGSVIIPGSTSSSVVTQDFGSVDVMARAKHDIGKSFVGAVVTDREAHEGGGHNLVVGPDFQLRLHTETVTGQWLVSDTRTPNRPDLSSQWTGGSLQSHAAQVQWSHSTTHVDTFALFKDIGADFRADMGFMPQVGVREEFFGAGYTVRPNGPVSRIRVFLNGDRQTDAAGTVYTDVRPGIGMDTRLNGFLQFQFSKDEVRAGTVLFPRRQVSFYGQMSPSRAISLIEIDGHAGDEVDFANNQLGRGAGVNTSVTLHPTNHLELDFQESGQWLWVDTAGGGSARLFVAAVSRIKGTYTVTARSFFRVITQSVSTTTNPALYVTPEPATSGGLSTSALVAYKLNWQSVLFIGYGDDRTLSPDNYLQRADRQLFVKISYALQK